MKIGGDKGQYYMYVNGIVKIQDENGNKIYGYSNKGRWDTSGHHGDETAFEHFINTYNYDMNEKKENVAGAVLTAMKYAYTINEAGTITMYKLNSNVTSTKCIYMENVIYNKMIQHKDTIDTTNINYLEKINPYIMPIDFLVTMLEITASSDFIDAVCDLVNEEEIILVIAADDIITYKTSSERYQDDITAYGIEKKIKEEGGEDEEREFSESLTFMETSNNGNNWNIEKIETNMNRDTRYNAFVKKAKTWYGEFEYDYIVNKTKKTISLDENGEEITNEGEWKEESGSIIDVLVDKKIVKDSLMWNTESFAKIEDEREKNSIWIEQDELEQVETVFATDFDKAISKRIFEDRKKANNLKEQIALKIFEELDNKKNFFKIQNSGQADLLINDGRGPKLTRIVERIHDAKRSNYTTIISKEVIMNNSVKNSVDHTDRFLGLLKNDDGVYSYGAMFNPSGKKVCYKDSYQNTKPVAVGDLLENGDKALLQFLESSSQYSNNLAPVMRYILYRYTNEDYGINDFDEIMDWINSKNFSSVGGSSLEECLHQMMASYEGRITTSDGKKYLLLNGANNDGFDSISTAYGMMFYAKGYLGYAYEEAMNLAYKDCGYSDMSLDKAIGSLINSDGSINVSECANNAFPEKYALPVDVVDRAHLIGISEHLQLIRRKIENYNKKTGKNLKLNDEQIAAIVDGDYQYVDAAFDCDEFIEGYGNLGDNPTEREVDLFLDKFIPFNDPTYAASGRPNARRKLFKDGIFTLSDGTQLRKADFSNVSPSADKIVSVAKEIVNLTKYGGSEQAVYEGARRAKNSNYSSGIYVCASFVSEVLYNATGLRNWSDDVYNIGVILNDNPDFELVYYKKSDATQSTVGEFAGEVNTNIKIEDIIQPGDVVASFSSSWRYQHVILYIGDNQYAHHGGGSGVFNYPNISSGFLSSYTNNNVKYIFRYKK